MKVKIVLFNFLFIIVSIIIFFVLSLNLNKLETVISVIGLLCLLMSLLIVISWVKLSKSILNLFMFFLLFLIIFNFGQFIAMFLNSMDMKVLNAYTNSLIAFSRDVMFKSACIAYFSILCLHIGGLIAFRKRGNSLVKTNIELNVIHCKYVGIVMFFICLIPTIIFDLAYLQQALNAGYSLSSLSINYGIIDDLARTMKVSIIFLLIGYKDRKKTSKIIFYLAVLYSVFKIWIIGQRGYEFIFLIIISFIYYRYIQRFNFRTFIKLGLIIVFLLSLMNSIVYIRETTDKVSLSRVIDNIFHNNIVIEVLAEFGSTFYTTELIVYHVPEYMNFSYGIEYASSLLSVFPNIGNLNNYLNSINIIRIVGVKSGIGIGGSLIGEAYYNFGYGVFIFMIIVGSLLSKLFFKVLTKKGQVNFLKVAISLALYQNIIWLCRDSIMSFPRKCIFELFLPYIIYWIVKKYIRPKVIMISNERRE